MEGRGVEIALQVCPCSTGISSRSRLSSPGAVQRPPSSVRNGHKSKSWRKGQSGEKGLDSSFTLAKHEIANDAYELKEAEDGTRTGTKRQIDQEIHEAQ